MRIFAANLLENKSNVDRILKKNRSRINTATATSLVSPHFRERGGVLTESRLDADRTFRDRDNSTAEAERRSKSVAVATART